MIYYFTGQPGSGKTTLGRLLIKHHLYDAINIDGDDMREFFKNNDYSESGRRKNIELAHNIAYFLSVSGFDVVISMVSPFKDLRDKLKNDSEVVEIFVHTDDIRGREDFKVLYYEPPTENFYEIDTTNSTPLESYNKLKEYIFMYINKEK